MSRTMKLVESYADQAARSATSQGLSYTLSCQKERELREQIKESLNAEIRRAKAEALREAADRLIKSSVDLRPEYPTELSYINCTRMDASMLRSMADEIEAPS